MCSASYGPSPIAASVHAPSRLVDRHRRAGLDGTRSPSPSSPTYAGPPRLPRQHRRLLAGQGRAVCLARPARRGDQHRRRSRRRAGRRPDRRGIGALDMWTVSAVGAPARLPRGLGYAAQGLAFTRRRTRRIAVAPGDALIGEYNVANLLGVLGALRALGLRSRTPWPHARGLESVPGRMERIAVAGSPAGGGGLRAHAGRARKGPRRPPPAGSAARRRALVRLRLRRRPRRRASGR